MPSSGCCSREGCPLAGAPFDLSDNPVALRLFPLQFKSAGHWSTWGPALLLDWAITITQNFFAQKRANGVANMWREADGVINMWTEACEPASFETLRKQVPAIALTISSFLCKLDQPFYLANQTLLRLGLDPLPLPDTSSPLQCCAACATRPEGLKWGPHLQEAIEASMREEGEFPGELHATILNPRASC